MEEQTNSSVTIVEGDEEKRKAGRPVGTYKKPVDRGSFLKQNGHEFDKVIKKSAKHIEDVMEALAKIATDENASNSERTNAGKIFMENMSRMVEQRNKDDVTRKIAEIRVRGNIGAGSTAEEDDSEGAIIDFDTINPEFANNEQQEIPNS
jgi:hypothetical protein